jgi:hypothetical protein
MCRKLRPFNFFNDLCPDDMEHIVSPISICSITLVMRLGRAVPQYLPPVENDARRTGLPALVPLLPAWNSAGVRGSGRWATGPVHTGIITAAVRSLCPRNALRALNQEITSYKARPYQP